MTDAPEIGWQLTWDDRDDDYVAVCGGERIGRVYREIVGARVFWCWFAWWYRVPNQGQTPSRREAMLTLEQAYEADGRPHTP